jgi:hypothetical protein
MRWRSRSSVRVAFASITFHPVFSMKSSPFRTTLLLVLVMLGAAGCTAVQPWERATLSSYPMRPDRDPLAQAMAEHIYFSREAAAGGRSVGGSGCGCN